MWSFNVSGDHNSLLLLFVFWINYPLLVLHSILRECFTVMISIYVELHVKIFHLAWLIHNLRDSNFFPRLLFVCIWRTLYREFSTLVVYIASNSYTSEINGFLLFNLAIRYTILKTSPYDIRMLSLVTYYFKYQPFLTKT